MILVCCASELGPTEDLSYRRYIILLLVVVYRVCLRWHVRVQSARCSNTNNDCANVIGCRLVGHDDVITPSSFSRKDSRRLGQVGCAVVFSCYVGGGN